MSLKFSQSQGLLKRGLDAEAASPHQDMGPGAWLSDRTYTSGVTAWCPACACDQLSQNFSRSEGRGNSVWPLFPGWRRVENRWPRATAVSCSPAARAGDGCHHTGSPGEQLFPVSTQQSPGVASAKGASRCQRGRQGSLRQAERTALQHCCFSSSPVGTKPVECWTFPD